jgi:hypothetical protein
MKKLTIAFAHAYTWRWTAIAVHFLKKFQFPLEHEIIVVNNSPTHPSIKCLTETGLADGIRIIDGDPELPSHGQALSLAFDACDSDWIFTSESDALPVVDSWGNEYIKASADHDYIGPWMELAGGHFIHPCGAMSHRKVIEAAKEWRKQYPEWVFINGAAKEMGFSDKAYHLSITKNCFYGKHDLPPETQKRMENDIRIWSKAGPWQEMLAFEDDSFDNYWKRGPVKSFEPVGNHAHLRIGYEPGQWLSGFAIKHFKCLSAPFDMKWVPGFQNRQAAYSDVFGAFRHVWAGTSSFSPAIDPAVRSFKMAQMDAYMIQLPQDLQKKILTLEAEHA